MNTILSSFDRDPVRHGLLRELSDVDHRQLLDMGLVRAADGSLWLAEDPSRQVAPDPLQRQLSGFLARLAGALRWLRTGQNQRLHLSRREPY